VCEHVRRHVRPRPKVRDQVAACEIDTDLFH
jgi:hypothetical protein